MSKETEEFERFCETMASSEPEALRGLIDGWEVLECRGNDEHRVLLIRNDQGEKRILKQFSHRQNARMRAEREALNEARVDGIPKLFDYAEDDRFVYLVREYVEGVNLEEWIGEHGPMSVNEAARIGEQLAAVLAQLHMRQIIHRDVKPQNVIMTPEHRVVLIDFDISRKYTQGEEYDTEYLGTRNIAPPEQFGYGQTDARTDLYSLGVLLLYLVTGSYELREMGKLPRPLRRVVRRCTHFAPERRYQTAAQVRHRLRAVENRPKRLAFFGALAALCAVGVAAGVLWLGAGARTYPSLTVLPAEAVVTFREPTVEAYVRAKLGKGADEPLRYGEISDISEIYLYGTVADGQSHSLKYIGNKVYADDQLIHNGTVDDLTDLLMFPKLRVLRLFRQPVSDVDALAALTRLEELSLDESPNVTDISAVSQLEWLRTLDISDTSVGDISALAGCPRLRQIDLERIPCENYSVLSRYHYLELLNVNAASPEAVMAAVSGKMIDYLWLDHSGLTDIGPFLRAEGVEQLHAKNNEIRSLEGIDALTMLEYVDVAYNPVEDLSPVLSLPRLKALRIDRSMTAAWDAIKDRATFRIEWQE
ncbi:MAG: protein kinase [Clostridiales bacterium]|nr:protein kinase [Clostridiales bacterium]